MTRSATDHPDFLRRIATRPGASPKAMLFYRDFTQFSGGHLKTWHYFGHVLAHPAYEAVIQFSTRSLLDETNPWYGSGAHIVAPDERATVDAYFLGGLDWRHVAQQRRRRPRLPVINIIQHIKHADVGDERYQYLRHRAVRICVSPEIAAALHATKQVNGPVLTIENAIELKHLPRPMADDDRMVDLLIAGTKQPALADSLGHRLALPGRRVRVIHGRVPRPEFLDAINQAKVSLFLPNRLEGFYLPALEGMALRSLVVCPNVIGNGSFCRPGQNCFLPVYSEEALVEVTEEAVRLDTAERATLLNAGEATARVHDIASERAAFHRVLDQLEDLFWG